MARHRDDFYQATLSLLITIAHQRNIIQERQTRVSDPPPNNDITLHTIGELLEGSDLASLATSSLLQNLFGSAISSLSVSYQY